MKKIVSVLMLITLILTITACGKQEETKYYSLYDITENDSFYIKAEKEQYELNSNWDKLIKINSYLGEYDYLMTDQYDVVEKKIDGQWYTVAVVNGTEESFDNREFFYVDLNNYVLYSDIRNIEAAKYNFEKGNYRVIREYHNTDDSKGLRYHVYVAGEFELV